MAITNGTKLGPYEILAPLGAGGMGEVYRARDTRLGREVAVKVLPGAFTSDPDRLRRFEQEARAAGALNHPNILVLHDVGVHDGTPYLVTELLEGETLRERLDQGALSPRKAIDIALQIARGLAAAHDRGLVHRDLKPANLFVLRDGRVKILDFGLAKLIGKEPTEGHAATATVDTDKSVVMGTAGYMAPEQVRGQPADHRADIFAFGAILYEMLTGRRAFQGETSAETMTAILREEPPELARDGHPLPPALDRIVRHCLEKNPPERFQSASDIAFALEALSGLSDSGPKPAATPGVRPARRFLAPVIAGLVLLGAGLVIGHQLGPRGGEAPVEYRKLTFKRGPVFLARFAENGQRIYYSAAWDGDSTRLYSCDRNTPGTLVLSLPSDAFFLGISRSNVMAVLLHARERVHFSAIGTLASVTGGGAPREILEDVTEADWSPDGSRLAVIHIVSNRYRVEYPIGTVLYDSPGWVSHLRVSPDGKRVAFLEHSVYPDDRGELMVASAGTSPRSLSPIYSSTQGVAWTTGGTEILFTGATRGASRSIRVADLTGHCRTLTTLPDGGRIHDIAPSGDALVTSDHISVGILGRRRGETAERDLSWLDWSLPASISADGRTLLFDEEGEGGGEHYSVCVRSTDGSAPVRLGEGVGGDLSPDGKWALVVRFWEKPPQLTLLPTGVGEPRALPPTGLENIVQARFLPSGNEILVVGNEEGHGQQTYVRGLDGGPMRKVGPEGILNRGLVSPDGRWTVGTLPEGAAKLYALVGSETRDILGKATSETPMGWSSDGKAVFVATPSRRPPVEIYRLELATGKRAHWERLHGPEDRAGVSLALTICSGDSGYVYVYGRALCDLFLVTGLTR